MSERHADQGHRKFWATMKEMTWKKRFEHFFYYYGKYTIIAILLIYMMVDVLYDALKEKPEVILSGTAINVSVSVDMEKRLTDDAFVAVGGTDPQKQEVTLVPNKVSQTDLFTSSLQTKLQAGDYHYVLLDEEALNMVIAMQTLPDMTLVIPEEKLDPWKDRFVSVQSEGVTVPVAIDITGTVLASECTVPEGRIFLAFPVNQNTLAVVEPFFDYLVEQGLLAVS